MSNAATVTLRFTNSEETPFFVQVDPWAGVYSVMPGETLEIMAESDTCTPEFDLDAKGDHRFVTLVHSTEYHVVINGRRYHCTELPSNVDL